MEDAEREREVPVDRLEAQEGMHALPGIDGDEQLALLLAAVEHIEAQKWELFDCRPFHLVVYEVLQPVGLLVPTALDEEYLLTLEVADGQLVAAGERVRGGYRDAKRHAVEQKPRALAAFQERIVEGPCHDVDVLAEVREDSPGVFGGVLEGDKLEGGSGAALSHLGPKFHQKGARRHGRGAHTDGALPGGIGKARPLGRLVAVLDDVADVCEERLSRARECEPSMRAVKERHPEVRFQDVHLLDDGGWRYVKVVCRLGEAAEFRDLHECVQLMVVQGHLPPRSAFVDMIVSVLADKRARASSHRRSLNPKVHALSPIGTSAIGFAHL